MTPKEEVLARRPNARLIKTTTKYGPVYAVYDGDHNLTGEPTLNGRKWAWELASRRLSSGACQ